jgi:uncharacterized cupin superfamily protein
MPRVIIENLTEDEIKKRGIRDWPQWTKEVSKFDWYYDGDEECLFIEGDVIIETAEGKSIIKPGDFVTFQEGLKCTWDIKKPVKKYYNFK